MAEAEPTALPYSHSLKARKHSMVALASFGKPAEDRLVQRFKLQDYSREILVQRSSRRNLTWNGPSGTG